MSVACGGVAVKTPGTSEGPAGAEICNFGAEGQQCGNLATAGSPVTATRGTQRGVHLETVNAVLDVLGYDLAFLPRSPTDQAMRDRGRNFHVIDVIEK